jgi:hypothetical protein
MKNAALNLILIICLVLSPWLVSGQQVSKQSLPIKTDTVQVVTFKQESVKAVLGKYDYYKSLGVACKAELKLEKATKIPFRFRLGSLQQTDYLERKPNAQKP